MPPWLPVLKAALPYIGNIVAAALPVFTARRGQDPDLLSRQIAELQEAATSNAETLKLLATQLQETVTALDKGEADLAQRQAGLLEALNRAEATALQAQDRLAGLENAAAAMQARGDEFDRRLHVLWRLCLVVAGLTLIAVLSALLR